MKQISVFVVSIAMFAAACSGDDGGGVDTTRVASATVTTPAATDPPASTSTAGGTTEPTPPPSTTTAAPTTAPATTSTGQTDWASVVQTLGQRRQDLYAAPDVGRIPEVCAAESPCAEQLNVQLADLANKGWHVVDADPYAVIRAQLEDFDGDSVDAALVVTVVVVVQRPSSGGSIVDASGAVVAAVDPETAEGVNTENRTTLGRSGSADDPWRIISQERIREVPG
jgi:hypothetical protein